MHCTTTTIILGWKENLRRYLPAYHCQICQNLRPTSLHPFISVSPIPLAAVRWVKWSTWFDFFEDKTIMNVLLSLEQCGIEVHEIFSRYSMTSWVLDCPTQWSCHRATGEIRGKRNIQVQILSWLSHTYPCRLHQRNTNTEAFVGMTQPHVSVWQTLISLGDRNFSWAPMAR